MEMHYWLGLGATTGNYCIKQFSRQKIEVSI